MIRNLRAKTAKDTKVHKGKFNSFVYFVAFTVQAVELSGH